MVLRRLGYGSPKDIRAGVSTSRPRLGIHGRDRMGGVIIRDDEALLTVSQTFSSLEVVRETMGKCVAA